MAGVLPLHSKAASAMTDRKPVDLGHGMKAHMRWVIGAFALIAVIAVLELLAMR